jgi:RNA polymerase sigma-70 factor (ECF subfamily)
VNGQAAHTRPAQRQPQVSGAASVSATAVVPQQASLSVGSQQTVSSSGAQQLILISFGCPSAGDSAPPQTEHPEEGRTMTTAERLWHDHSRDLRAFLERRAKTAQDADDLLQEIFLRAVRTPPATPGPAWLYTVARNVLTDYYRRAVHHRETTLAILPDRAQDEAPETNPAAARAAACTAGMLRHLPAEQAEALRLVDMAQTRQHQAAQAAGVSVSGMKSRVQRGRTRLRALVEACCAIGRDPRGTVIEMGPCDGSCS